MKTIAVYDSGIGGIMVLYRLMQKFKECEFVYYGDNARMPYGSKTQSELLEIARENITYLSAFSPDVIVLACNTLTECALPQMQSEIPVVGVSPVAALSALPKKRTAVLCTPLTARAMQSALPSCCRVFVAEGLANQIERGITQKEKEQWFTNVDRLMKQGFARLHLGCTHYVWLKMEMQKAFPKLEITDGIEKCLAIVHAVLPKEQQSLNEKKQESPARFPAVHFVGEGAIKNQNTYLCFLEQMFKNSVLRG
ncbi:MAG: aspartate/glutamate racemase family protein [Clostridia bacterium]|nr:aspartate/glutamate racemase family protein [Clostridia bacterium]